MKEHPGHFWICFWLWMIWLALPNFLQINSIEKSLSKIASAVEQTTTAPRQ